MDVKADAEVSFIQGVDDIVKCTAIGQFQINI